MLSSVLMTLMVANVFSLAYANHQFNCWLPEFESDCTPPNDDASQAIAIPAAPYVNRQSTVGASMQSAEAQPSSVPTQGQASCPNSTMGASVWYKHSPIVPQSLSVSTVGSSFDTLLAVWVDWDGSGILSLVGCNDNFASRQSRIQIAGAKNAIFWFQIGGVNGATGSLSFELLPNTVPNDNLVDAIPLPVAPSVVEGSNVGATLEGGEYQPCGNVGATIWYKLDLGADGYLTMETSGSSFDTVLSIYQWDGGTGAPYFHACNDDASPLDKWSRLSMSVYKGSVYYIQVGGAGSDYGAVKLMVSSSFMPMPATEVPVQKISSPKTSFNYDGSISVYVDTNGNGQPDSGEIVVTTPPPVQPGPIVANPKTRSNPDGSTTVYNDANRNESPDPGETIITIPRLMPTIKVKLNPNNTITIYDDKNGNNTVDTGEEIFTTPTPPVAPVVNPKVQSNPDGTTTVYNDANSNGQADQGETIITIPSTSVPPPGNDDRASARTISTRAYVDAEITLFATNEATEPTGCGSLTKTVWYKWARSGSTLFESQGSSYPVTIAVYSVAANGALTLIGCSTTGSLGNATFGFVAKQGTNYLLQVGATNNNAGVLKFSAYGL